MLGGNDPIWTDFGYSLLLGGKSVAGASRAGVEVSLGAVGQCGAPTFEQFWVLSKDFPLARISPQRNEISPLFWRIHKTLASSMMVWYKG